MEKTLKYNLDESYAQGYNDAREEIIKALIDGEYVVVSNQSVVDQVIDKAIKIIRSIR